MTIFTNEATECACDLQDASLCPAKGLCKQMARDSPALRSATRLRQPLRRGRSVGRLARPVSELRPIGDYPNWTLDYCRD